MSRAFALARSSPGPGRTPARTLRTGGRSDLGGLARPVDRVHQLRASRRARGPVSTPRRAGDRPRPGPPPRRRRARPATRRRRRRVSRAGPGRTARPAQPLELGVGAVGGQGQRPPRETHALGDVPVPVPEPAQPPDEPQRGPHVPRGLGGGQRRAVLGLGPAQLDERGPGVDAELVRQQPAYRPQRGERVRLPSGPVEREDEELPAALAQRVACGVGRRRRAASPSTAAGRSPRPRRGSARRAPSGGSPRSAPRAPPAAGAHRDPAVHRPGSPSPAPGRTVRAPPCVPHPIPWDPPRPASQG
jgi:hypothetical protein